MGIQVKLTESVSGVQLYTVLPIRPSICQSSSRYSVVNSQVNFAMSKPNLQNNNIENNSQLSNGVFTSFTF